MPNSEPGMSVGTMGVPPVEMQTLGCVSGCRKEREGNERGNTHYEGQ